MLTLSLLAALAAMASLFAPDSYKTARIDWNPRTDANPATFDSYAPEQQVTVKGTWAPDLILEPTVVTTGFFDTSSDNETRAALRVEISADGVRGELVSPLGDVRELVGPVQVGGASGGFPQEWSITVDQGALILETLNTTLSTPLSPDRLVVANWLEATGEPLADVQVVVELAGGALDTAGPLHALFIWIAIALMVVVLILLTKPWGGQWLQVFRNVRLSRIDAFVAGGLVLSAFVSRTTYDDGWMLHWAQDLTSGSWGPTTPFMITPESPAHLFQGFVYNSLLGVVGSRAETIIGIRLLTVVTLFGCWLLLSRLILPRILGNRVEVALWPVAAFMVIYGLGWMTLRVEIPIFFASIAFLAIAAVQPYRNPALAIVGLIAAAAFPVATHPIGLMMALPLIIVLLPIMRNSRIRMRDKLIGLLGGCATAVVLVFFNQSLGFFLQSLGGTLDGYDDTALDPFNEWGRFSDLFRIGTISQRAWFLAGLLGIIAIWVFALKALLRMHSPKSIHNSLFAAAVMPLGLVFTASKWPWHYSALMAPMVLGLALAVSWLSRAPRQDVLKVITLVGVTSWIGLAVKDSEFDRQWTAPITLSALVLSALAIYWPRRGRNNPIGRGLIAGTVVLAGVTTWNAVELANKSTSGWSFLEQSIYGLWDADLRCGISSVIAIDGDQDLTALQLVQQGEFAVAIRSDFQLQNPCFQIPRRENGLWQPAFGAVMTDEQVDPSFWLHSDELAVGCVELAGPGTYRYPYCFRQTLPTGISGVEASLIDASGS